MHRPTSLLIAFGLIAATMLMTVPAAQAGQYDRFLAPTTKCGGQISTALTNAKRQRVLRCLVNYARIKAGRTKLVGSRKLNRSARRKSSDLLRCGAVVHTPCGEAQYRRIIETGYTAKGCGRTRKGENLGFGAGNLRTPRAIMTSWINSRSHRRNVLGKQYRHFGVKARAPRSFGGATRPMVIVMHFGASKCR